MGITTGQSHALMQALACNVDWDKLDPDAMQSIIEHAKQAEITEFLQNGARLVVGRPILTIDRSTPFDPAMVIGDGWSIWRGPADGGGLNGEEQECKASLACTSIDLTKTALINCRRDCGQERLQGEVFLRRVRNGWSPVLDAKIGQTLFENSYFIPESWKKTPVYFMGTELRAASGSRCVLCLCWNGTRWDRYYYWLGHDFNSSHSAVVGGK